MATTVSKRLVNKEDESDATILREDQDRINTFARLNQRSQDIKDELVELQKVQTNLEEACDELMIMDDSEPVKLKLGDCFVTMPKDQAEAQLEKMKEEHAAVLEGKKKKLAAMKEEMTSLKVILYAKFGKSINLEAPEDE